MLLAYFFLTSSVLSGDLIVRQQADTVYIARQAGVVSSSPKELGEYVMPGESLLTIKQNNLTSLLVAEHSGNIKEILNIGSIVTLGDTIVVTESNYWLGIFIASSRTVYPKLTTDRLCINKRKFLVDKIKSNYEHLYFTIPKGQQTDPAYDTLSSYVNKKGKAEISLDSTLCK